MVSSYFCVHSAKVTRASLGSPTRPDGRRPPSPRPTVAPRSSWGRCGRGPPVTIAVAGLPATARLPANRRHAWSLLETTCLVTTRTEGRREPCRSPTIPRSGNKGSALCSPLRKLSVRGYLWLEPCHGPKGAASLQSGEQVRAETGLGSAAAVPQTGPEECERRNRPKVRRRSSHSRR
jgi:hypothetical protein